MKVHSVTQMITKQRLVFLYISIPIDNSELKHRQSQINTIYIFITSSIEEQVLVETNICRKWHVFRNILTHFSYSLIPIQVNVN